MIKSVFSRIFRFYVDGFRNMDSCGRQLWFIILLKIFIFFVVFKLFFFPDFLKSKFETDEERSSYVLEQLTNTKK